MINVLVVEDNQVAAEAHRLYVQRLAGFQVAGVVHSGTDALRFCQREAVDIILLNFYLPDMHGLDVCLRLRAAGNTVYIIAVTAERGLAAVHAALSLGIQQYLLKPFKFASLRDKLEDFVKFQQRVPRSGEVLSQAELDDLLGNHLVLPSGITLEMLREITKVLAGASHGLSAAAVAGLIGVSRVTAGRYLKYLADTGLAQRRPHYGQVGRPEVRFIWHRAQPR